MQPIPPDSGEVIEEFVERVGGPTALANKVGVSFHAVFKWRKKREVTDSKKAILWVEAMGIRVPPELRIIAGLSPEPEGGVPATVSAPVSIDEQPAEDEAVDREVRSTAASARWGKPRRLSAPPRAIQGILCALADRPSKIARWLSPAWCPPGDEAETA